MQLRGLAALLVLGVLVGSACQGAAAPSTGAAAPTSAAASLMTRLASDGDRGLFEARYLTRIGDDAVLYVGVKDGAAVGYLCDPGAGSRWFTGTSTGSGIDLRDAKGGHLTGPTTADAFDATLSGVPGYDGAIKLPARGEEVRLVREGGAAAGGTVGGLVFDGDVIRGVITVNASGTIKSGTASIPVSTAFAIGVRSTVGPRIDLTISMKPRLDSAQQAVAVKEIRDTEDKIRDAQDAATTQFWVATACAAATVAAATGGASVGSVSAAAASALKGGALSGPDPSVNAFLSNALKGIVEGLQVTIATPRPSSSGSIKPVTLGTITFGAFSGGL